MAHDEDIRWREQRVQLGDGEDSGRSDNRVQPATKLFRWSTAVGGVLLGLAVGTGVSRSSFGTRSSPVGARPSAVVQEQATVFAPYQGLSTDALVGGGGGPEVASPSPSFGSGASSSTDTVEDGMQKLQSTKEKWASGMDEMMEKMRKHKKDMTTELEDLRQELEAARSSLSTERTALKSTRQELSILRDQMKHQWYPTFEPVDVSSTKAFVMMAIDQIGSSKHKWGVLAMAHMIRTYSKHPLVLLTNSKTFVDGTDIEVLSKLSVKILPIETVPVPPGAADMPFDRWRLAWQKLQIWKLTQYEKLIWLDTDATLTRSIDYLFDESWMKAQRDDWYCKGNINQVCSGILLLRPNATDYAGLLAFAKRPSTDFTSGDQGVISQYFEATKRPIQYLQDLEASFGQCIGKAPTPYRLPNGKGVVGQFNLPTFVHKAGGWFHGDSDYFDACFEPDVTRQLYMIAYQTINVCHYHPLGHTWRNHFCQAVALLELKVPKVAAYCDDDCWLRGNDPSPPVPGVTCGPLAQKVSDTVYNAKAVGQPVAEAVPPRL